MLIDYKPEAKTICVPYKAHAAASLRQDNDSMDLNQDLVVVGSIFCIKHVEKDNFDGHHYYKPKIAAPITGAEEYYNTLQGR